MASSAGNNGAFLSERLLRALTAEVRSLERASKPARAQAGAAGIGTKGETEPGLGAKARVEAISLLTRTLEKLLELKRLEALERSARTEEDGAEADRLRAEMLKRLRALDARRAVSGALFAEDVPDPAGGDPD